MISKTTKRFRNAFADLPDDVRRQAQRIYRLFAGDPNHPSIRFKKIHGTESIYSARISLDYRALGVLHGKYIIWYWIGTHAEYDKQLGRSKD